MADIVVTLNIMPESPDTSLEEIEKKAKEMIKDFSQMENWKITQEPVAFGLKALKIMFVMAEDTGSTDPLEEKIASIEGVNSIEVTDVRRTIG